MDKFAVAVMPVVDVGAWKEFCAEASSGDRSDAHKDFLRRSGVKTEHIIHHPTPMGDLMVLVWEGVDQDAAGAAMGRIMQDPQSDHEKYLRDHVISKLHGVDVSAPPPPPAALIATTAT